VGEEEKRHDEMRVRVRERVVNSMTRKIIGARATSKRELLVTMGAVREDGWN